MLDINHSNMDTQFHNPFSFTVIQRGLATLAGLAAAACSGPGDVAGSGSFGPGPSVAEAGDEDSDAETSTAASGTSRGDGGASGDTSGAVDDSAGPGGGPGPMDDGVTTSDPTTTSTTTTTGPEPECPADSTCCAGDGMFVPAGGGSPGCSAECSACDGQGSCEPRPAGNGCGGGEGTCDGAGGCNVPTCNDGLETLEAGEECDGDNLGGQTCSSQGFDGGSLSCHANCTFDTGGCYQANIVPSPGLLSWTPAFVPNTMCTCDVGHPFCHTLYRGKVNSFTGNVAHMEFQKMDGTNPSVDITYWVVVGDLHPTCLDVPGYVQRATGMWDNSDNTLEVDVNVWPSEAAFDAAACGDTKDLFVITGGAGGYENTRTWYQEQAVRFTKVCV